MRVLSFLCAWVVLVATATAAAQPVEDAERFRALVLEAIADYDAGLYAEALATFEQAYALRPSARVLRGIGMCRFEQRRYAEALTAIDQALASEVDPLEGDLRAEVVALRERAARYVGSVRLVVDPASAEVRIDGRIVTENVLTLDVGDHEVVVSAPGMRTEERTVSVMPSEESPLRVTLSSGVEHTVIEVPVSVPAPVPSDATAWAVPGVLLAVVGVGGVIGGAGWLVNRDAAVGVCADAVRRGTECLNAAPIVLQRDLAAVTVGISAAALTAGAVVLLAGALVTPSEAPEVACGAGPDGVFCGWSRTW